jgi:hypothetical protein
MEDSVAIQQLMNRYSVSSSRGNIEDVVTTFVPDGIWRIASLEKTLEGQAAIRDGLTAFTSQQDYVMQQNAPAVITIDGDSATATSVVCERGKLARTGNAFEALGFYVDKLLRTAEGWRFKQRSFELVSMRTFPATGHQAGT